jgi:hypothetical protein
MENKWYPVELKRSKPVDNQACWANKYSEIPNHGFFGEW